MNTPVAAFFKTVGNAAFSFMLPILAGYIAYSIADRPGLAVGFVGGYLASVGTSFWDHLNRQRPHPRGLPGRAARRFCRRLLHARPAQACDKLPALEGIKPT